MLTCSEHRNLYQQVNLHWAYPGPALALSRSLPPAPMRCQVKVHHHIDFVRLFVQHTDVDTTPAAAGGCLRQQWLVDEAIPERLRGSVRRGTRLAPLA